MCLLGCTACENAAVLIAPPSTDSLPASSRSVNMSNHDSLTKHQKRSGRGCAAATGEEGRVYSKHICGLLVEDVIDPPCS